MDKTTDYMLYLSGVINEEKYLEAAEAAPAAANATSTANDSKNMAGNLQVSQLLKFFPNQDPMQFKIALSTAMRGGKLNLRQSQILGEAFVELLKADPQTTVKIMQLIKKVSAE